MPNDMIPIPAMYPQLAKAFARIPEGFPSLLAERYPRVLQEIETLWGSRNAIDCLNRLLFSDRFDRQGFSEQIVSELTLLVQVHEQQCPEESIDPNDPFYRSVVDHCRVDPALVRKVGRNKLGTGFRFGDVMLSPETAGQAASDAGQEASVPGAGTGKPAVWHEITHVEELRQYCDLRAKRVLLSYPRDQRALGEILVSRGIITREVLDTALRAQKHRAGCRQTLGEVLVGMKAASPDDVMRGLCLQAGIPMVDLSRFRIARETANLVRAQLARQKRALPIAVVGKIMFLAVDNPFAFAERNYFSMTCNRDVELAYAPANMLTHRLETYGVALNREDAGRQFSDLAKKALNGRSASVSAQVPERSRSPEVTEDDATVIGLVNKMIDDAVQMGASDIHIEAFPNTRQSRIRFRRDGRLEPYSEFPSAYHEAVISRIKIMSDLDISERRRAQDGKISYARVDGDATDLRVATIPTVRNIEDITIRLLPCGKPIPLEELGMAGPDLARLREVSGKPYGLVLVCGPTGSGKTTTLHSVLQELNTVDRKIWTAEDPVEIVQANICQVQVNSRIGWTFASALRSFLRADPDVIMIGEMRDIETAKIALEASMTGHLVLSTLHTNSASETAARLIEMGIDPFTLSDALLAVLAQRLAQRLCAKCATVTEYSQADLEELAAEYHHSAHGARPSSRERDALIHHWRDDLGADGQIKHWTAQGCEACSGTGYRGRVGLFELAIVTPEMRQLMRRQAQGAELRLAAIAGGMRTMKQDGIKKALRGLTDMRQVRAVCL